MKKFEEIVKELRDNRKNLDFVYSVGENVDKQPFTDEQLKKFQEIHFDSVHMRNKTIASLYTMISSDKGQKELTERLMGWGVGSGGYSSFGSSDEFDDLLKKAKNGSPEDRANLIVRVECEALPPFVSTFEAYLNALLTTKDVHAADELLNTLYDEDLITERHSPKDTYIMRDALWVLDAEGVNDIERRRYIRKPEETSPTK